MKILRHNVSRIMVMSRSLEGIIERQIRLWEIRGSLASLGGEPAREAMVHLREGPYVTLSRQMGSGGTALARAMGAKLGWQVFDQEILALIARQAHSSEQVLSRLDERAVTHFHEVIARLLQPGIPDQMAFLQEMLKVIWALGHKGKAIMLGRGANWVLDGRFGLRVRVVAPRPWRIAHLSRQEDLGKAEAQRRIDANDAAQKSFIRQVYSQDIDDPQGYDLTLNNAFLDLDSTVGTVLAALKGKLSTQS